jgi:hypothetical protein
VAPYWFPVLTLILGAVAGYLAEEMRENRADRRAREKARRDFERDTLLDLQEWLAKLARATGAIHHQAEMEYREKGTWARDMLGEELNLADHEAIVNVQRLRVRVNDEAIRDTTKEFVSNCVAAGWGAAYGEDDRIARARANEAFASVLKMNDELHEAIGARIRALS